MSKYGMFDTAAERDSWVAERDRKINAEAARLADIGIRDGDDLVRKYSELCDLFMRASRGEDPVPEPDDVIETSDEARRFADRVLEIMHGRPWREGGY